MTSRIHRERRPVRQLPRVALASTLALLIAQGGCLSRRIFVTSDPPGARLWLNDVEIGRTPVATEFTYFGTYNVRLEHDGFQTLETPKKAVAPWYEYPVVDLLAIAAPWSIETKLDWHFELEPSAEAPDRDEVLNRARQLKEQVRQDDPGQTAPRPNPRRIRERQSPRSPRTHPSHQRPPRSP